MSKEEIKEKLLKLKNGEHLYFNMFQDGGAVAYKCNGYLMLFSIPLYGGCEAFEGAYMIGDAERLIDEALSWT
jgi:hypothetical protein